MRTLRFHRPQCEAFEPRFSLNASPERPSVLVEIAHSQHHVALSGAVSGTYSTKVSNPDAGHTQTLLGRGQVAPLGIVQANGTLQLTGFVTQGRSAGTITLSNPRGSVTLSLLGFVPHGFSGPPATLSYKITEGTGAHTHDRGHGTVSLAESASVAPLSGPGNSSFTLTFRAGP